MPHERVGADEAQVRSELGILSELANGGLVGVRGQMLS